jgi:hypothetical protein
VSHWWHLYQRDGDLALNQEQRGREPGAGRHLSDTKPSKTYYTCSELKVIFR